MSKRIINKIKSMTAVVAAIAITLGFGIAAIGCKKETNYDRAIRIARESFGCKKVLWCGYAVRGNSISRADTIEMEGESSFYTDYVLGYRGGYYVVGLNKNGEEQFILIPNDNAPTDSSDGIHPSNKPTLFDWPFAYSFSEMASFMGENGYPYAEGIEGKIDEYRNSDYTLYANDRLSAVMSHYRGDDSEEFVNRLDVEFTFTYYLENVNYLLTQEGGKLKLYEWRFTDSDMTTTVRVYGEQV